MSARKWRPTDDGRATVEDYWKGGQTTKTDAKIKTRKDKSKGQLKI